jgi:phosphoribosylpyrophosphate synthetase
LSRIQNMIGAEGLKTAQSDEYEEYYIIYHSTMEKFVDLLIGKAHQFRRGFIKCPTVWGKFSDGSDNIRIDSVKSPTHFKWKNILFVASFHTNEDTLSQYHVIAHLCESFARSLTVLLPYYTNSTMERMDINKPTEIPTANTTARLFNGLPSMGYPVRIMTYDLHTLQNRFYVTGHAVASLHTATTLMVRYIKKQGKGEKFNILAFPDAGAHKRFADLLREAIDENMTIICGKERDKEDPSQGKKNVKIETDIKDDAISTGKRILIVDDILKSGGTFIECADALKKKHQTAHISVFATHSVLDEDFTSKFNQQSTTLIDTIYTTNSIPNNFSPASDGTTTNKIKRPRDTSEMEYQGPPFHVLDLTELVLEDL